MMREMTRHVESAVIDAEHQPREFRGGLAEYDKRHMKPEGAHVTNVPRKVLPRAGQKHGRHRL